MSPLEWQVNIMAILKHIANKNRNYSKALEYLVFQHDEFTQKPLLDDHGHMMLRDEIYLEGLNCDPLTFSAECDQVNKAFCKNCSDREIKSHHYIISFDPLDKTERGLMGAKAQEIGMEFARKYFAGHQALVCTHTDGHNESGNIHVHIILNSVRKDDIEPTDFTERPCDSRAGFKHHLTDKLLSHMQQTLMDICEREHLHQVDLLSPAADKISDREYRKKIEGVVINAVESATTPTAAKSRFQTEKQILRDAIRDVSSYAHTPEEFGAELEKHYGIRFKISRGRYSYLHPDRSKYITGRNLGNDYTEDFLIPVFEGNAKSGRVRGEQLPGNESIDKKADHGISKSVQTAPEYDPSYDYTKDFAAVLRFRTKLKLVVDLQSCAKAQASRAYARKVKLSNLQTMAKTICYVQEHGYNTLWELEQERKMTEAVIDRFDDSIHHTNEQIIAPDITDDYWSDFLHQANRTQRNNQKQLKKYLRELDIVCKNVHAILDGTPEQARDKTKAQELL